MSPPIYDWAIQSSEGLLPAVDQLDGAVDASIWAEVTGVGGNQALATFDTIGPVGSRRIRMTPTQSSSFGQGIYINSVAGDFIYYLRLGESRGLPDVGIASNEWYLGAGFVDGADVNTASGTWLGRRYVTDDLGTSLWELGTTTPPTAFDSGYVGATTIGGSNAPLHTQFDVILQRSGTTLILWGAGAGEAFHRAGQGSVSTSAGLIVVRLFASQAGHDLRGYLDAFARRSTLRR
jgi:hypothetical protein